MIDDGFLQAGTKRMETLVESQRRLLETFEQINRERMARVQQEMELASAFASRLSAARSMPDVMSAYQEWAQHHLALFADDSRRLVDEGQKVFSTAARLLSNGGTGGPPGSRTP
jgi:hypothetical protein